jgi:hypothetical protein
MRRAAVLFLGALTALVPLLVGAPAAGADPAATISSSRPQPGDTVHVRATGLKPGEQAVVDYLPDGVRFGIPTITPDGTIDLDVRIPPTSYDGPKQIQIRTIGANGRYVRLDLDLTIAGVHALARLSSDQLRPGMRVGIQGDHFFPSTDIIVVIFPEQLTLLQTHARADGVLDASFVMPAQLLNGRHGVLVAGRNVGGTAAFLKMFPTVSGGTGQVPKGADVFAGAPPGSVPTGVPTSVGSSSSSTSSTSSSTTARTSRRSTTVPVPDTGNGMSPGAVVLVVLLVLAILALVLTWRRAPRGKMTTFR